MSTNIVCPACGATNRVAEGKPMSAAKCGKCGAKLFTGKPVELNDQTFAKQIRSSDVPVVVDFWAQWCGPCKMMAPEFAKATARLEPTVRMAKVNTEQAQQTAAQFGIRSIPTLMVFQNGKVKAQQPGAMGASDIEQWVRSVI